MPDRPRLDPLAGCVSTASCAPPGKEMFFPGEARPANGACTSAKCASRFSIGVAVTPGHGGRHTAAGAINGDQLAVGESARAGAGAHDGWDAVLAGNDRGVRGGSP